ncbi:MAG: hypothetical protein K6F23_09845 [Solobacterium sp.]|nr:hypothetical protein [Solobacterium sp.]
MTNLLYMLMNFLNNSIKKDTNYYLALALAQNITSLPAWSLERTAAECNVSVSTLNRFFKDMGFENFSGAKKILLHDEHSKDILFDETSRQKTSEAIGRTLENINRIDPKVFRSAVDKMIQSKKIIFYAYGNNINLTLKTQVELMKLNKLAICNIDILRQNQTIREADADDLLFCISINGKSLVTSEIKDYVTEKKMKSILVTQLEDTGSLNWFDLIINFGPNQGYNSSKYGVMYILDQITNLYKTAHTYF